MRVVALIPAAGLSTRMGEENKMLVPIMGIPLLARTLMAFQECDIVEDIALVLHPSIRARVIDEVVEGYGMVKVRWIVDGGETRQDSVRNGLLSIDSSPDVVLIHDGARPFPSRDLIERVAREAFVHGAAVPGIRIADTVKMVDGKGAVVKTLDRDKLMAIQTPQGFLYRIAVLAHKRAEEKGIRGTDDSFLVEALGRKVRVVEGEWFNIKVTRKEDLVLAEAIASIIERGCRR
jgi:2-C-methyl-D-erythritol 4-phosphate cytidylyltransferase